MTGGISLGPKISYLSKSGSGFNSSLGKETTENGVKELAKGGRGS